MGLREKIRGYRPVNERPPITSEERLLGHWRLKVHAEWGESGKLMAKRPDGSYIYTAEQCKEEAKRRQEDQESTIGEGQ